MAEQVAITCWCLVQCGDAVLLQADSRFPSGVVAPAEAIGHTATRVLEAACGIVVRQWQQTGFVNLIQPDGQRRLVFLCTAALPAAYSNRRQGDSTHWQAVFDLDRRQLSPVAQTVFDRWQANETGEQLIDLRR